MLSNTAPPKSPGSNQPDQAAAPATAVEVGSTQVNIEIPGNLPYLPSMQEARVQVNTLLVRYGHIIPLVAVAICLLVSSIISIERQVRYSNEYKKSQEANQTGTTPPPAVLSTTAAPGTTTTVVPIGTTEVPIGTTEDPTISTEVPIGTTEGPIGTTEDPTISTEVPIGTTEVPIGTTEGPIGTTEDPTISTEVPIGTTEGPVITSEDPISTTVDLDHNDPESPVEAVSLIPTA